ncbi:nuclear body protein SP140-like protein isoform X1 [Perca flavescens]|uniref:nuclear body protein SP140-like protein isoform X1 n=1 Tax=Perca flavescens TaxID=8167 RepID=UPI00106EFC9A|nr:nuclear body protein SP140-like protein isoform X1 [Perca flavescens]
MDPMDWLDNEELLRFFHCHKTEMSCLERPHTFLDQLRDHDLIAEDKYKKVRRMKSKDNMRKGLYEILDLLEKKQSQRIKTFWSCIFKETIMNQYPTLRLLHKSLMDGSFHFEVPESVEKEEADEGKRKELSEDEEEGEKKQKSSVKKKRKLRSSSERDNDDDEEEEQAGPSSQFTPRKKSKKLCFSSPLKKGEKNDIWTWPIYKLQLPVTCGDRDGALNRHRLAEGEKCIMVDKKWLTPNEFERYAGKQSHKNWKLSIKCMGTPLAKLIQEGHLKAGKYKGGCKKAKQPLFPSDHLTGSEREEDEEEDCDLDMEEQDSSSSRGSFTDVTDGVGELEEQTEQQPEASNDSGRKVFKVTCGALAGTLHKKRFASGTCGKSIRTETSWMTPVEFVNKALCQTSGCWRKDIKWEGEPIGVLLEAKILESHSLLCICKLCRPDCKDLLSRLSLQENQKNDDECSICKTGDEEELVVCDHCPRSFHQKCHLPHIEDTMLGDDSLWMCTFCVFGTTKGWLYMDELEREAAMSRQISRCMLQCQYLLLYLGDADEEQLFATNPCLYLLDYSRRITTPMWLGKVADKLQKQLYQTVGEFVSDIQLIFTNCATYNRDKAEFLAMGSRLKNLFDKEFNNVFNIKEETVE